jgi:hypothetical protein
MYSFAAIFGSTFPGSNVGTGDAWGTAASPPVEVAGGFSATLALAEPAVFVSASLVFVSFGRYPLDAAETSVGSEELQPNQVGKHTSGTSRRQRYVLRMVRLRRFKAIFNVTVFCPQESEK